MSLEPAEPRAQARGLNITDQLLELSAKGLRRTLRTIESTQDAYVTMNGRRLCCMCSNNYLGLASHPEVIAAVKSAVERWGWGAGASRLVSGHMGPHAELEARLAAFENTPAALVCSTGYQANLAAIRGLAGPDDILLLDKLNHASIIDAARGSGAVLRVFPHRDYAKLERLLDRSAGYRRRIIITDSIFSMDGDFADLPRLADLKRRYDALLIVDEAHATGIFGRQGRGVAELMQVEEAIDVTVGTLSKALGGIGGFIAASTEIIDLLVNVAGPFIYTTALPPAACAAALAALDLIEREPQRREKLLSLANRLRAELGDRLGFDLGGSTSQIVPIIVGEAEAAVQLSRRLEEGGFLIPAIRPPTVPRGRSRLRISLSAGHDPADVDRLVALLETFR
ncbi:MAG TPA: 8-amino-7-oxononanoate synthase [Phycisphaerae bacterium]|jgi:8-amino-7-oxononanoate synthase|nr:8-amino-7-oxononanoate synthase [Phycisphaerae bacterium]HOB73872.1 8-amino-7-oxononanoate synthase [Phycisphaerae bacterium]HOJ56647.1 8-amino-7-oxononanoate synthase [Phycisphaerae bacterium]HOL28407.1 8-amino-7-oxononanoate synthase [Phycisphaerae bacterium]HPP22893.1 8-amino-7-oxononanoate synthase [Phycisphaerae bacterium]